MVRSLLCDGSAETKERTLSRGVPGNRFGAACTDMEALTVTEPRPQAPTLPERAGEAAVAEPTAVRAAESHQHQAGRSNRAGQLLALVSVVPALLVTAWSLAAFPLAAIGAFRAYFVVPLALVFAAVLLQYGVGLLRRPTARLVAPWWATAATVAIAVAFAGFAAATHSQQAVLRRDAGSYAQIGLWLSQHGGLTAPIPSGAFGSASTELAFASPAFYTQGDVLVPQFMTGWPSMLAAANWVAGWQGMFILPALVGGAMVLAIGGLAARLIGARWAPLAALLVALAWPVMRVSQTTYSEPLAAVILGGAICLFLDAFRLVREDGVVSDDAHRRIVAAGFVVGLVLSAGELVRLDMGVDVGLLVPVIGWWFLTRRPGARAFVTGAIIGGTLGLIDCLFVTLPYVRANWESVSLMVTGIAVAIAGTTLVVARLRVWGRSPLDLRWWPRLAPAGAACVLLLAAGFLARPYLLEDHSTTNLGVIAYTAEMQGWLGLPIDGTRGYTEHTLSWVSWYLGWPLLAAALVGATALVFRVLRSKDAAWIAVLLVYGVSAVLTLWRPGITPDHPWADRRLVVEVIPAMVLLATWTVAAATRLVRSARWPVLARAGGPMSTTVIPATVIAALVAAFVLPMIDVTARMGPKRTEIGEVAAAQTVCQSLRPDDSVVLLDPLWVPTIRTQCGLPVASSRTSPRPGSTGYTASIRAVGRTPVFGTGRSDLLPIMPADPVEVVALHTQQDQHQLVQRPQSTDPLLIEFWLSRR